MNSASVDLIYLDPPFNSKANYAAPIGSRAAGAEFKDTWDLDDVNLAWHGEIKHEYPGLYALLQATQDIHGDPMMSYLIYMSIRLMEMRRLLKPTGSIYLHCDWTASHYLKLLMDSLFGVRCFQNEVVWCYGGRGMSRKRFQRKHDIILFYGREREPFFNREGASRPVAAEHVGRYNKIDSGGRRYARVKNRDGSYSNIYLKDVVREDWWKIPFARSPESTGYPTQKPLALLRRIILASSNEGDTVLDPFCGCATACIAAELEHREWVGIDISSKAADLVKDRMEREVGLFFRGAHRTDIPQRTDIGKLIPYNDTRNKKFLYGEQGGYCNGCQTKFDLRHFHVDHIIPRAKGGTDHITNLQLLCAHCNSVKGTRSHEHLLACLTDKGWIKRRKAA